MNADWHSRHVLAGGAPLVERVAWHGEHQRRCGCRPIPRKVLDEMRRDERIDRYLGRLSPPKRMLLQSLRKSIHAIVPDVEECISYGMPAFRFGGKVIGGFASTSRGCSYYPFSGATLTTLAADVVSYRKTKSALHFGPDRSLPVSLVRKLLKARIAEYG